MLSYCPIYPSHSGNGGIKSNHPLPTLTPTPPPPRPSSSSFPSFHHLPPSISLFLLITGSGCIFFGSLFFFSLFFSLRVFCHSPGQFPLQAHLSYHFLLFMCLLSSSHTCFPPPFLHSSLSRVCFRHFGSS